MFKHLRIKHFRLFHDLEIGRLHRINLFAGRNNSGKTAVLEALFLLCGMGKPDLVLKINAFRGILELEGTPAVVPATYWKPLFSGLDMQRAIKISGQRSMARTPRWWHLTIALEQPDTIELPQRQVTSLQDGKALHTAGEASDPWELRLSCEHGAGKREEGRIRVTQQGLELSAPKRRLPFMASFLSSRSGNLKEDAVRLGRLRTRKQGHLLTEALRVVEPRLQSVEDTSASGVPMIWGDIGLRELVPLSAMGEGMTRIARILLAVCNAPGGVVLVDEIENGFHYSIMKKVWAVLAEAAQQFDTQLFATTHSFECFRAAQDALRTDSWRFHRMDKTKDGTSQCVSFDPDDVEASIRHGLEVR